MATLAKVNSFRGGVDGQLITVGNSGGASGDAFSHIIVNNASVGTNGDPAVTYEDSTPAFPGSLAAKVVLTASTNYLRHTLASANAGRTVAVVPVWLEATPTNTTPWVQIYSGSTLLGSLQIQAARKVAPYRNSTLLTAGVSTTVLAVQTLYWLMLAITPETGDGTANNGQVEWRLLSADFSTQLETWSSGAVLDIGTGAIDIVRYGGNANTTGLTTVYWRNLQFGPMASGWPTQITNPNPSLTSSATAPGVAVVVAAGAAGGTGALTYAISQTSGPATAPALISGTDRMWTVNRSTTADLVYSVSVSESGGGVTTSTVTVPQFVPTPAASHVLVPSVASPAATWAPL